MVYQTFIQWILECGNRQREKNGLPPLTPTEAKQIWADVYAKVTNQPMLNRE